MYEYFKGIITEINPSCLVLETGGIGYFINISLHSFNAFAEKKENEKAALVYVHQVIREDANTLYGFAEKKEREIFRLLISVSGVGANTARLILSSLSSNEISDAIASGNVNALKEVKGIGAKSAQRIIIDLKDKISTAGELSEELFTHVDNSIHNEALSALVTLGFARTGAEKMIQSILKQDSNVSVENLVKACLKRL